MVIGDTLKDLQLEDGRRIISHVNEYTYLGVRITIDGNHVPEINDKINRGRAAVTKLNNVLWDRDVTPKTKTHIYLAVVRSTITYAAETWCLKAKTHSKTKFHRNGLLATLSSKFQEGQNWEYYY
jgi:hypothetical protein